MKCCFSDILQLSDASQRHQHTSPGSRPPPPAPLSSSFDTSCKTELNHPMSVMKVQDESTLSPIVKSDCKMIYGSLTNGIPTRVTSMYNSNSNNNNNSHKNNSNNNSCPSDNIHPELKNSYLIGQLLQEKPKHQQQIIYDCCSYKDSANKCHGASNCDQVDPSTRKLNRSVDVEVEYLGYNNTSNQVKLMPQPAHIAVTSASSKSSSSSSSSPPYAATVKSSPAPAHPSAVSLEKAYQQQLTSKNNDPRVQCVDDDLRTVKYQSKGPFNSPSSEVACPPNSVSSNMTRSESRDRQLWEESNHIDSLIKCFNCSYSTRQLIIKTYNRACALPEFFASKMRTPMIAGLFYVASVSLNLDIPVKALCHECGISLEQLVEAYSIINKHWSRIQSSIEPSDYNLNTHKTLSSNYQCDQSAPLSLASSNVKLLNGHLRSQVSAAATNDCKSLHTHHHHQLTTSANSCVTAAPTFPLSSSSYLSKHSNHSSSVSTTSRVQSNSNKVSSSVATLTSSTRRSPFYMIDHGHSGHLSKQLHDPRVTTCGGVKGSSSVSRPLPSKYTQSTLQADSGTMDTKDPIASCLSMPTAASFLSLSLSPVPPSTTGKQAMHMSSTHPCNVDSLPMNSPVSSQSSHGNAMIHRSSVASFAQSTKGVIQRNTQSSVLSQSPSNNYCSNLSVSYAQPLDLAALKSSSSLAASMTNLNDYNCSLVASTCTSTNYTASSVMSSASPLYSSPSFLKRKGNTSVSARPPYLAESSSKLFQFAVDQPKMITREANARMCYQANSVTFDGKDIVSNGKVSQVTRGESISMHWMLQSIIMRYLSSDSTINQSTRSIAHKHTHTVTVTLTL